MNDLITNEIMDIYETDKTPINSYLTTDTVVSMKDPNIYYELINRIDGSTGAVASIYFNLN